MSTTKKINELHHQLIIKEPSHFSTRHLVSAFFGSLLVALTFMFKGQIFRVSESLTNTNLLMIVATTLIILAAEIYYVGYARVTDKRKRPIAQFMLKRLIAYYSIAIISSWLLIFIYNTEMHTHTIMNMVIAMSLPASLGAAASDLLNKY